MKKIIEIPEGYEARIEGNMIIFVPKENEDERIKNFLIGKFREIGEVWHEYSTKDIIAWLEKQGSQNLANSAKTCKDEQKPAWSEEDEVKRNALICLIEEIKNQPLKRLEDWDGYISWLKSLKERYTWKPSDEQMGALDDVISSRDVKYNILSELWKELKKLKG